MKSILATSPRTVSKILRRMRLSCFKCGWGEAICDIHHIVPRSKGGTNDHSNLTILCPNCHRVVHEQKILTGLKSLEEAVGDNWKDFYYTDGTKNPTVKKQVSDGMKLAHAEGRSTVFGKPYNG